MSLTLSQAEEYLTNILKINDWKLLLQDDKLAFITSILRSHVNRLPFQNITYAATAEEDRRNPSEAEIVKQGLTGKGGVCIEVNHFVKLVLETLGFNVFSVTINWAGGSMPGTHYALIVQLSITESYLIDVGCDLPVWEPVPLYQLPYRRFTGGYPFEFRRSPEGLIQRFQVGGSYFLGKYVDVTEKLQYSFKPEPSTFDSFEPAMKFVFTSNRSMLSRQALMCRQEATANDLHVAPNFYMVWGRIILKGYPDRVSLKEYSDYTDEWKTEIKEYFPNILSEELDKAVENFKKFNQKEYYC